MSRHSGLDWASIVAFIMVMLVLALLCVVTIANRKAASGTNRQADVPDAGTNEEPTVRTVSYNGKIFECLSFPLPAYDGSSQHCNLCTERTENDYKSGTPPRYFACWR